MTPKPVILGEISAQSKKVEVAEKYSALKFTADNIDDILNAKKHIDPRPIEPGLKRILTRGIYIRPFFAYYWINTNRPKEGAKCVAKYTIDSAEIYIYDVEGEDEGFYYLLPREYEYSKSYVDIIGRAIDHISGHYPKGIDLENISETREYIEAYTEQVIKNLASSQGISLGSNEVERNIQTREMARCISRYVGGLGVIEYMLNDPNVEDVYIDAPVGPIYLNLSTRHNQQLPQRVKTNIMPTIEECENILAKIRYESGRPFSEANPVLEYDLHDFDSRVTIIGKPLSPYGIAMTFRKHSREPWTLLHFIYNGTISAMAAGFISFLVENRTSILVAGARGSGKTSFLGAMMLEFPMDQRIITIEDTLELPTTALKTLGFNVQNVYVKPTVGEGMAGMTYEDAIRVALRLGESALVLGEVRGPETKFLYEAMRTGMAGSSVMGTFHADSPKAVYQRVVHDIGIPPNSFQATDIIVMLGVVQRGNKRMRKLTSISEVIKDRVGEFKDLFAIDMRSKDPIAEATDEFYYRSDKIATISRSLGISLEDTLENIKLRAKVRETIVHHARETGKFQVLNAHWYLRAMKRLRQYTRKVIDELGYIDNNKIYELWYKWFDRNIGYA